MGLSDTAVGLVPSAQAASRARPSARVPAMGTGRTVPSSETLDGAGTVHRGPGCLGIGRRRLRRRAEGGMTEPVVDRLRDDTKSLYHRPIDTARTVSRGLPTHPTSNSFCRR